MRNFCGIEYDENSNLVKFLQPMYDGSGFYKFLTENELQNNTRVNKKAIIGISYFGIKRVEDSQRNTLNFHKFALDTSRGPSPDSYVLALPVEFCKGLSVSKIIDRVSEIFLM